MARHPEVRIPALDAAEDQPRALTVAGRDAADVVLHSEADLLLADGALLPELGFLGHRGDESCARLTLPATGDADQPEQPSPAQLFLHLAPSQARWQPPPRQVSAQVEPDLQVCLQPPPVQAKLHVALASQVCTQPPPAQVAEQVSPAAHLKLQPPEMQAELSPSLAA